MERTTGSRVPLVAVLTDFGTQDLFVGVMKGVIHSRCPGVRVVDLTHEVPPQNVPAGAFLLRAAVPYFPLLTTFLAVVDPGVGGSRRPLCLTAGGYRFIGPDNGLLWPAASALGRPEAYELAAAEHRLPQVSSTFHGRDLFAPAAAALAAGVPPADLGPRVTDPVRLELPSPTVAGDELLGEVLWVDRFGNLITNLSPADLNEPASGQRRFRLGATEVLGPVSTYSAVAPGELCVVLSSFGTYEIAVRDGNASVRLGAARGQSVVVTFQG